MKSLFLFILLCLPLSFEDRSLGQSRTQNPQVNRNGAFDQPALQNGNLRKKRKKKRKRKSKLRPSERQRKRRTLGIGIDVGNIGLSYGAKGVLLINFTHRWQLALAGGYG